MENSKLHIRYYFLWTGISAIVLALLCKFFIANFPLTLYYLLFYGGVILKLIFLLFVFSAKKNIPFSSYIVLLIGVATILASILSQRFFAAPLVAKVLLYIAIPLKIAGVIIFINTLRNTK